MIAFESKKDPSWTYCLLRLSKPFFSFVSPQKNVATDDKEKQIPFRRPAKKRAKATRARILSTGPTREDAGDRARLYYSKRPLENATSTIISAF
jgi:hypothetical protein